MPTEPDSGFDVDHLAQQIRDTPPSRPLHRCKIAGVPHRVDLVSHITKTNFGLDTIVNLVAEPHNAHDPNAIKVIHDGVHLGYIPKDTTHLAKGIARMKVVWMDPKNKWNEVHIEELS